MKLKKLLIGLIAFLMFASPSFAQSFGVRLGYPFGVQYSTANVGQQGSGFRVALETSFFAGLNLQADLMLGRIKLGDTAPLGLYYGAGAHVGFIFTGQIFLGLQATIGLEYLLQPGLSLGADFSGGVSFLPGAATAIAPYFGGAFLIIFKI